jgi:hypothetical protein
LLFAEDFSSAVLPGAVWQVYQTQGSSKWEFGVAGNDANTNDPPNDTTPSNSDNRLAGVQINKSLYSFSSGTLTKTSIPIIPGAKIHLQMQKWVDSDDTRMLQVLEVTDNTTQTWSAVATFTHDPSWQPFVIDLYPFISPNAVSFQFRFRFDVTSTFSNRGSISIDDVKIYDDACVLP